MYLEERRRAAEDSLAFYRDMLADGLKLDRNAPDTEMRARRLIAAVAGIALEACFAPDDWTVPRMHEVLAAELADLGAPSAALPPA